MKIDAPIIEKRNSFGSFTYDPHPPAQRSVYADLYGGMCLTFGNIQLHVNKWGVF